MAVLDIQSPAYWEKFKISKAEIELIFALILEEEKPLTSLTIAMALIEHRVKTEQDKLKKQFARGEIFQPKNAYKVGEEVLFPAFDYAVGKVISTRPGVNSDYGDFEVIEVEFEDKKHREFASLLTTHALNVDLSGVSVMPNLTGVDAHAIFEQYGDTILEEIEARLVDEDDAVSFGDRWFLTSLMVEVDIGQLHLAEALLDMQDGGPLSTPEFLNDLDFAKEVPAEIREFSLNVALNQDDRFDDVGALGKVAWFLRRLEPNEVQNIPTRLIYNKFEYDPSLLTPELQAIEREIDDELSPFESPQIAPKESTLSLIYPHRRVGTLPLTSQVRAMFPTALESPRIRVTLVDQQSGNEFAGWVVHDERYVCGLGEFYKRHKMPIGGYITIRATDDQSRLILDFPAYKPRTEHIRLAVPKDGRLTFSLFKRSIGATYDEFSIFGAEDIEGVDALWAQVRDRRRGIVEIMKEVMPELAKFNPQNVVHAKTIYGAVNILRRCPPGPIFAALVSRPDFTHVDGPYWRMS